MLLGDGDVSWIERGQAKEDGWGREKGVDSVRSLNGRVNAGGMWRVVVIRNGGFWTNLMDEVWRGLEVRKKGESLEATMGKTQPRWLVSVSRC